MKLFLNNKRWLSALLFFLGGCTLGYGQSKTLSEGSDSITFAAIFIEEPPFIYTQGSANYKGIIPEVAKVLSRELDVSLDYLATSRKGLEAVIAANDADFTWLSARWVNHPEQFVFSDIILMHKEYLFSLSPFNQQGQALDWLKGKTICIRQDYTYPSLDAFFERGDAQAAVISSQVPLMTLLVNKRCELLYMNHHQANWMAGSLDITRSLYRAPQPLMQTGLTFMFNKSWRGKMPQVNQAIRKLKQSGELSDIVQGQRNHNSKIMAKFDE